ncbi:hypothetical protein KSP39_PZI008857 [Platanthera zijinensis]|uniref:Uncharacterized protein n=1 Tax=Platanthera zijinensis TaxID=2320716 RepID=A0AAP0BNC3_9ASPA
MEREEQDGINKTVECLRGRLQAERMASKTAKAEADHLAEKLAELEKKLKEELERRGRAVKKLKHALKKLELVMIVDIPGQTNLSDSSVSLSSSSKCFQNYRGLDKWKDSKRPVEESLALVPVSIPEVPAAFNPEAKNNVCDVLFSLRHAREQLKNSMGRTVALYSTKELHGRQRASTVSMEAAPTK